MISSKCRIKRRWWYGSVLVDLRRSLLEAASDRGGDSGAASLFRSGAKDANEGEWFGEVSLTSVYTIEDRGCGCCGW